MKNEREMTVFMEKEYEKSLKFWDDMLGQPQDMPEKVNKDTDWYEVGSKELAEGAASLSTQKNVLDYGCGSGWASVIIAKKGCEHVTAVDVSENGVEASKQYAKLFNADAMIEFHAIQTTWLREQPAGSFDGVFCSNVLDVVPSAVCETILEGIAHVCSQDAKIVIGFNPYFEREGLEKRGLAEMEPNHLFADGILRLVNHTDAEWKEIFSTYFNVMECQYFRWPGEPDHVKRRLFFLTKK